MRKYSDDNQKNLETLVFNCCGKSLKLCNGMATEGVCHIDITWDIFLIWTEKITAWICVRNAI